jgi:hypothetical protein
VDDSRAHRLKSQTAQQARRRVDSVVPFRRLGGEKLMRGRDWQAERLRYVVHFSDGGAGRRYVDEQLEVGHEIRDSEHRSTIERVKQPSSPYTLGHALGHLERGA